MEIVRPTFSQSQVSPNQFVYNLPSELGCGGISVDAFPSGLCLMQVDMKPTRPITLVEETDNWSFGVGFRLEGRSEFCTTNMRQPVLIEKGVGGHFVSPGSVIGKEDTGTTHRVEIRIIFDEKTLLDLADEDEEPFLSFLKPLKKRASVAVLDKIQPEMKLYLNQLVACPYGGKTRALFLEGKTMEIFAHKLEELRAKGKGLPCQPRISASDIERIHFAAELLVSDPVNPPDLTELAGQIGMSRSKFFHHFKSVYEHSPMEHLRSHRMQVAKQLLQQGEHNITEIAFAVGFNSLSYFTRTFTSEFGISPRQIFNEKVRNPYLPSAGTGDR